jgi:hypothetical protein
MPFGFIHALTTFMRMVHEIFKYYIGDVIVVYLDDILIFLNTWKEHLVYIQRTLQISWQNHL